jgi:hypothetical protein
MRFNKSSASVVLIRRAVLSSGTLAHRRWAAAAKAQDIEEGVRQCLDPFKLLKILQDSPSHRIFRRMHGALNIGKKITNCTVCL